MAALAANPPVLRDCDIEECYDKKFAISKIELSISAMP
jgi:hypothetical protein